MNKSKAGKTWEKLPASNLVRYVPSQKIFARVRVGGKLILKSLKTETMSVAMMRLNDLVKDRRSLIDGEVRASKGKMLFGDALAVYEAKLDGNARITEGAKIYRRKCIKALLASWPSLAKADVRKIKKDDCESWAARFSDYSPSVYNNTVGTLRGILDVAIECGTRYGNPASAIAKRKPTVKKLVLPTHEEFRKLVVAVDDAGGRFSHDCAHLIQFLSFGGFRKTEASHILWGDCDFIKGQIHVRITKNGEARYVPMIPEMQALLERIKAERENAAPTDRVMAVQECQKAIDSAAGKIKMARITHHDLRHLFATRCIESGVDIQTVAVWLGHKDRGALAMKVYGHLRDEHSTEMAKKVSFGKAVVK